MDIGSEGYAIEREKEEAVWQRESANILDQYYNIMNRCLSNNSAQGKQLFCELLTHNKNTAGLSRDGEFANMIMVREIYQKEISKGITHTILHQGISVQEIRAFFRQMKFWLFELEFSFTEKCKEEFMVYLKERDVSDVCLDNMIEIACVNKDKMRILLGKSYE